MQLPKRSTAAAPATCHARAAPALRGRSRACCQATVAPHIPAAAATDMACLEWAATEWLASEGELTVAVARHKQYGRSLVAVTDIAPHEVILSVNLERVFASQPAGELHMHWAADMALRLLSERAAGGASSWHPWLEALPAHVATPVEFTPAEVAALAVPSTVQAVLDMQSVLEGCYCELEQQLADIGASWQDFLAAVQVLHSRCFFEPTSQRHLAVPGIDFANHAGSAANAGVRLVHSPAACQGLAALQEVADDAAQQGSPLLASYFQLVAGNASIAAGEEVCISYGSWPAEPFLLLFGFVPQPNEADGLTLFSNERELAAWCVQQVAAQQPKQQAASVLQAAEQLLLQQLAHAADRPPGQQEAAAACGPQELVLSRQGVGGRLPAALEQLQRAATAAERHSDGAGAAGKPLLARLARLSLCEVLTARLQELCGQLQAADDAALSAVGGGGDDDASCCYEASPDHEALAAAYRGSRLTLARELLRQHVAAGV